MDVIALTRELGKAIQADERYAKYLAAKEVNDKDDELQKLIGDFNLGRMQLNQEMSKSDKDNDKINELNTKIRTLYGQIMTNPSMSAYNDAKVEMDRMLDMITNIITLSENREEPLHCQAEPQCSGSCATCGVCH